MIGGEELSWCTVSSQKAKNPGEPTEVYDADREPPIHLPRSVETASFVMQQANSPMVIAVKNKNPRVHPKV